MAITATFSPSAKLLTEFGDSADNTIITSPTRLGEFS